MSTRVVTPYEEDEARAAEWQVGWMPSVFDCPEGPLVSRRPYRIPGTPLWLYYEAKEQRVLYSCDLWCGRDPTAIGDMINALWEARYGRAAARHGKHLRDFADVLVRLWALCEERGLEALEAEWRLGGVEAVRPLFGMWPVRDK